VAVLGGMLGSPKSVAVGQASLCEHAFTESRIEK